LNSFWSYSCIKYNFDVLYKVVYICLWIICLN
jgi:hypothetical protein